jgi:hypothetical protein
MDRRAELMAKYGYGKREQALQTLVDQPPALDLEKAFVTTGDSGRTLITAPVQAREIAQANSGYMYLTGRFVEADTPNRNKAMWTTGDLEMGAPTVANGPLNWLHQEFKIVGTLLDGTLVPGKETADAGGPAIGNHIVSNAVVWKFLYPQEARAIEHAAATGHLAYSMECISKEVACTGPNGCGDQVSYADYDGGRCCTHLRQKASVRHFVDPIFLGGALILPPTQPGWADAKVDVLYGKNGAQRQAAELQEQGELNWLDRKDAEAMVTQLLAWANR